MDTRLKIKDDNMLLEVNERLEVFYEAKGIRFLLVDTKIEVSSLGKERRY